MTTGPVRAWHLLLLPAVLAANWLFMAARHEATHGLVVLAFGGEIAEMHLWPPVAGTLSWITFRLPLDAPDGVVPLQAAAPSLVALLLLVAGTWLVCTRLGSGIVRANVALTAVVFPCCELLTIAAGYWYGGGDLSYVVGTRSPVLRVGVPLVAAAITVLAVGRVLRRIDGHPRNA